MRERILGTRGRIATVAGVATGLSVAVGLATNHWIRTSSTDVGMNLIVIVVWVATMMAAAALQTVLAADLLWGERSGGSRTQTSWSRRTSWTAPGSCTG